ncbi:MAG: Gfo/Idh/MocA family protein [Planctomycetota bacterium]
MRAAVIGCGSIGPVHLAALIADPRVGSVVACDRIAERARRCAGDGAWSDDPAAVIDDPGIALVCVCTPHPEHAQLARAALATGKHVLCEKPLATDPPSLAAMCAAAEDAPAGVLAAGVFQHRFSPLARALRSALATGAFGVVRTTAMEFRCTRDVDYYTRDRWRGTWVEEGGGVLLNQAIHTLDLWLWFVGTPVAVRARAENRWTAAFCECEDHIVGEVDFASGLTGAFAAINDRDSGWHTRITLDAEYGRFVYDSDGGGRLHVLEHRDPELLQRLRRCAAQIAEQRSRPLAGKACYGSLHAAQIADLLDAIEARREVPVDFPAAAVANQVVLAAYHAAATGATAPLPLTCYRQPPPARPPSATSTC